MIRDKLIIHKNNIDLKCYSCKKYNHDVQNCKLLHYEADIEVFLK